MKGSLWPHNVLRRLVKSLRSTRRGQSLVEVAVATPMLLTLALGIVEFGFLFSGYVQVSNAAREGARAGSRYVYLFTGAADEQAKNDEQRGWGTAFNSSTYQWYGRSPVVTAVRQELSSLPSSGFDAGSYAAPEDLVVTYPDTAGTFSSGPRWVDHIQVKVTYHYRLPVLTSLLPVPLQVDLVSETTMAVQDR